MRCPGCGGDVVEKAVFCHLCGARLNLPQTEDTGREENAFDSFNWDSKQNDVPDRQSPEGHSPQGSHSQLSSAQRFREAMGAGNGDSEESNLWEGGYAVKAMMGNWITGCFLSIGILALGTWIWSKGWSTSFVWWGVLVALTALWLYLLFLLLSRRLGVHYRLTSQRFFHENGILRHTTDLIEVIDMDDITFEQSLLDRFTGVGSIHIVSSDRSHPELTIDGIENVKEVAAKMQNARHAERLRRGLHIEQI